MCQVSGLDFFSESRLGSSVIGLSIKSSFNLNLRQNVSTFAFNSVVFVLGTGVKF